MLDPGQDTRDRLLDAAERLFAAGGFAATSLRAVTHEAGVNVAAAHYHFGSKGELLRAVFARRVAPVNAERLARLDALARRTAAPPAVEEVLEALVAPAVDAAARSPEIAEIAALLHSEPATEVRQLFEEVFGEVRRRFTAALQRCLPSLPPAALELRFTFAIGALVHVLGRRAPIEIEPGAAGPELVAFLAAGLRAPACAPLPTDPVAPRPEAP